MIRRLHGIDIALVVLTVLLCVLLVFLVSLVWPREAQAYTYDVQVGSLLLKAQTSGPPLTWAALPIAVSSALGPPYDAAVFEAALTWSAVVPVFTVALSAPVRVRWAELGELPPGLLAQTERLIQAGRITRATVVLDPLACWDLYEGPLQATICQGAWAPLNDLQRVVLHELGHVAGLEHPDEGGQVVSAIMNSQPSVVETLTADDATGLRALYPVTVDGQVSPAPAASGGGGCALQPDSPGVDAVSVVLLALWGLQRLRRGTRVRAAARSSSA